MARDPITDIEILYKPKEQDQVSLDILAVNGLFGGLRLSWDQQESDECQSLWLKDLLPEYIPNAQVLSFEYDIQSSTGDGLLSRDGLDTVAKKLLQILTKQWPTEECRERPMTVIAHDIGGIVVKKALMLAQNDPAYHHLLGTCHQLVFFNTPHRASDMLSWEDQIFDMFSAAQSLSSSKNISLKALRAASRKFWEVTNAFGSRLSDYSIINVFQAHLQGDDKVVSQHAATTDLICETKIERQGNYKEICKFVSEDEDFMKLLHCLRQASDPDLSRCLSTLLTLCPAFPIPETDEIALASLGEQETLETWLTENKTTNLYLRSESGSRTTTLASALFHSIRTRFGRNSIMAYYSFTQTDRRRVSTLSLISALIVQLIYQDSDRFSRSRDLYQSIMNHSSWIFDPLWTFFMSLLSADGSKPIICVVNDIDACDSSLYHLLDRLAEIQRKKRQTVIVKFIFIGELREDAHECLKSCPGISLEGSKSPKSLLEASADQFTRKLIEEKPYLEASKVEIERKLCGSENMLQLSITANVLSHRLELGLSTPKSLQSELRAAPFSVRALVMDTIQQLPAWGRKAVSWILRAERPMTVNELATALALVEDHSCVKFDGDELFNDLPSDLLRVLSPLVTIERGQICLAYAYIHHYFNESDKAQFQSLTTVKNISGDGNQKSMSFLNHWDITRILLKYLDHVIDPIRDSLKSDGWKIPEGVSYSLLEYAIQYWPSHYKASNDLESHAEELCSLLDDTGIIPFWAELRSNIGSDGFDPGIRIMNPILLAAQFGFSDILHVCIEAKGLDWVDISAGDRDMALSLASWGGHENIIEKITSAECDLTEANNFNSTTRALINATSQGRENIVSLLITKARARLLDSYLDPVLLCLAAELGNTTIVISFINAGARIDALHEGKSPLELAARNGHEAVVESLLSAGAHHQSNSHNQPMTPLLLAAWRGHTGVMELLLHYGADVSQRGEGQWTALHFAAESGHKRLVKLLLDHQSDTSAKNSEERLPLHVASMNGYLDVVKILLESNPDVNINAQDERGCTSLRLASDRGHLAVVEFLLEKNAKIGVAGQDNRTAIFCATSKGHKAITDMLLRKGGSSITVGDLEDVFLVAAAWGFLTICKRCIFLMKDSSNIWNVNSHDDQGWTSLHHAAANGHEEIVDLLLQEDVSIEAKNEEGDTALALAVLAGHSESVRMLIDNGANALDTDSAGRNLIYRIAIKDPSSTRQGHLETIQILVDHGIDVDQKDDEDRCAVYTATKLSNFKVIQTLISCNADLELRSPTLWTPLHSAARFDKEIAQLLIQNGSNLKARDNTGWTPFHVAARYGQPEILELLWRGAPDGLELRDEDGGTPLHHAYDEVESMRWLLEHKVDVNATTLTNETTLMVAAEYNLEESVSVLLENGASPKARDTSESTALHVAAREGAINVARQLIEADATLLECQDDKLQSALHVAAESLDKKLANVLLTQRAENFVNLQDRLGDTALLLAIKKNENDNRNEVIELLINSGAHMDVRNKDGETALLLAIDNDDQTLMNLLLDLGCDINAGGGPYSTALQRAACQNEYAFAHFLVGRGADVNREGGVYHTALQAAACARSSKIVELLLENGADPSRVGGVFGNVLTAVIYSGMYSETGETLSTLLKAGAPIDAIDAQGRTAMHFAAWHGDWKLMKWLKDRGSSFPVKDRQHRTIVHYAAINGDLGLTEKLLEDQSLQKLNSADINGWTPLHWASKSVGNQAMIDYLVSEGGDFLQPDSLGWTPENIAVFNESGISNPINKPAQNKSNSLEKDGPTTRPPGKKWKVGTYNLIYVCDGCRFTPIYGMSFHCTTCEGFIFCAKCYRTVDKTHAEHTFRESGTKAKWEPEYAASESDDQDVASDESMGS